MNMLKAAIFYQNLGFSVVPQLPGAKQPRVKWKEFQNRLPTTDEIEEWWYRWPDAGIAIVLGPVSNLLAIDVDGPEAHQVLVARLGDVPIAPHVLSGSRKPHRYHLLFQHPDCNTGAKFTPWHHSLEFRGQGGIVIAPPSVHKSGHRYVWVKDRSLRILEPPPVPRPILDALMSKSRARLPAVMSGTAPKSTATRSLSWYRRSMLSDATREFLRGDWAKGPKWNHRLFCAACDLASLEVAEDVAGQMLLDGAQPWNDAEAEAARRTIRSAYSQPRQRPGQQVAPAAPSSSDAIRLAYEEFASKRRRTM